MIRKILSVAFTAAIAGMLGMLPARANTIYDFSYTSPSGTATGFIETNTPPQPFGTLGMGMGTIVNWDINLTIGTSTVELAGPLQPVQDSSLNGLGTTTLAVTASATELTADFGNTGTGGFWGFGLNSGGTRLCYTNAGTVGCAGATIGGDVSWEITTGTLVQTADIGVPAGDVIATAENTTVTPLPAALPLFATGLGGLGLLSWRRKRKTQAV
jgi:hypothetical protein